MREALALASRVDYDVVFLDISMPDLTGMDAARELVDVAAQRPRVVFVTAHDDHAMQAFTVDAVDYLLKPVSEERLARCRAARAALRAGGDPATHGGAGAAEGARHAQGRDGAAGYRRGATTPRPTATTAWIHADGERAAVDEVDARARGRAAGDGVLPHPPLATSSTCAAWSRWRPLRRAAPACGSADGTVLEVARRQTRALKQHLGLR